MLAFSRQNYTYGNFYIFKYHLDMHVHLVSWDLLSGAGSVTAPRSPASWWPLECGQDLWLDSEQQNAAKVMGFLWLHVPGSVVMLRKIAALSCGGLSLLGFEEVGSHVGEAHAAGNSRRSLGAVEQSLTYKKENYIRKLGLGPAATRKWILSITGGRLKANPFPVELLMRPQPQTISWL